MIIVWGQRMYGRVDRFAGSYVATRFFHIYYLPLIPLSSWLVLEEQAEGNFLGLQVPMQGRSVLSAWLRVFGIIGCLGAMPLLFADHEASGAAGVVRNVLSAAWIFALTAWAWFRLGKLDQAKKVARVVYNDFTGRFVDVGLMPQDDQRAAIKVRATEELDRHLTRHATSTYREAPQASWRAVATHADMRDVPLLRAALTRCRVEEVEAEGAARAELKRDHAAILRNLIAASPELADVKRYEMAS